MHPIRLVVVGKSKMEEIVSLENRYKKFIKRYVNLEVIEIQEGRGRGERQLLDEAAKIKKALTGFRCQVLLSADGLQRSSETFASWLGAKVDLGDSIAFAIGSSHGFHPYLKADVTERMALSSMTFPHDLCRLMFVEQLYRAFCIINGKTYHK
jgi:23S rRNA (pseudouridine1915-N3)-methyltransferase